MYDLGGATLHRIVDVDPFALALDFLFPGARLDDIEHARALLMPDHVDFASGDVLLGIQSFLLRTAKLNILIDTCVGEHKPRARRAEWNERTGTGYLDRLAAAGVAPDEIDVVLCTHLHADHVGWNTRLVSGRWVPTFAKARYLIGRRELQHWQSEEARAAGIQNHGSFADSIVPVIAAGQCEAVDDGFEIASGLAITALPGHSPGQVGVCLERRGQGPVVFCGDAIHSPVQVFRPDWTSPFCFDRDEAVRQRLALLERAAGSGGIIVPSHIRGAHGMRVERCGEAWQPIFV